MGIIEPIILNDNSTCSTFWLKSALSINADLPSRRRRRQVYATKRTGGHLFVDYDNNLFIIRKWY